MNEKSNLTRSGNRRSFLTTGLTAAGATVGAGLLVPGTKALAQSSSSLTAGDAAILQQRRHVRFVHPNADAIAGHPRLRDFEYCAADLKTIANTHNIVGQSLDREVLAELFVDEIGSLQLFLPVMIGFDLVNENGALLAAVPAQVALTISVEIQPADATAAMYWVLPDPCVYRAALPLDVARKSDVH